MRRAALVLALGLFALSCGAHKTAPVARPKAQAPVVVRWEDALDDAPEALAVIHPRAILRDKVYGPIVKRVSQAAVARALGVGMLEAAESADEIIVAMDAPGSASSLIVLRGVRADIDASRVVDDNGAAVWRFGGDNGHVTELVRQAPSPGDTRGSASLFVLPERTWVIASGDMRSRARSAYARPIPRPALDIDGEALASIRFEGPPLARRLRPLRESGALAAVGKRLASLAITLRAGTEGLLAVTLTYKDDESAELSFATLNELVAALKRNEGRAKEGWLAWLKDAAIDREPKRVTMKLTLPPGLLAGLGRFSEQDLEKLQNP